MSNLHGLEDLVAALPEEGTLIIHKHKGDRLLLMQFSVTVPPVNRRLSGEVAISPTQMFAFKGEWRELFDLGVDARALSLVEALVQAQAASGPADSAQSAGPAEGV